MNQRISIRMMLTVVFVVLGLLPAAPAAEIRWSSGEVRELPAMQSLELRQALQQLAGRPDMKRVVVQLTGPLDLARRNSLQASGVTLLGYLGSHAYFASLGPDLDVGRAGEIAGLSRVDAIATQHKLHPDLAQGIVRPWSIVSDPGAGKPASPESAKPEPPTVAVYVLFHRDFDAAREAPERIATHGGRVWSRIEAVNGVVAHIPAATGSTVWPETTR